MRIFADLHHFDLYLSFQLLFEKRLGHQLFRPVGVEWHSEGYWKIAGLYNNATETILQYLDLRDKEDRPYLPPYAGYPLNDILKQGEDYFVMKAEPINHNALTLEQFKKLKPDIVIASMPQHFDSFQRLINDYTPNAKLIHHFGNILWNLADYPIKNVMASIAPQPVPSGVNAVFYHQEFDTNVFKPVIDLWPFAWKTSGDLPIYPEKNIYSFVHVLSGAEHYKQDWQTFLDVEALMPNWNFKSYGASCRDGAITGHQNVADKMRESMFIWHLKSGGDGFGHVIHTAFAVGRPPIIKLEQYRDKLAGQLMQDEVTCLTIDGLSSEQIKNKIEEFSQPERYAQLSKNAYNKFKEVVDFNKEEFAIRDFLEKLQ